jgi:WD40 repeat protein
VAIAPDSSWLATAGLDGTVRIWDPVTGTQRHTLTGDTDAVAAVAIAPDGT